MKNWTGVRVAGVLMLLCIGLASLRGEAAEISNDQAVRYILALVKAFRTAYVRDVVERLKHVGIHAQEDWTKDDHAIMLPFEFVKRAGANIKHDFHDVDVGLISLTPINPSHLPKTPAEREALQTLATAPKQTILTFGDGDQYKGLVPDFAVQQVCADCHNHHPKSPKKDFREGDVMGAIVVSIQP